eukprot:COSAG06_NODE_4051_length_4630_cov_10.994262_2_plen_212_part_00
MVAALAATPIHTHRGREQQPHKRHRSMHCKRQRGQTQSNGCQHSSKGLTYCPHQTHTHPSHQSTSTSTQQHSQPCGIVRNGFTITSTHDEPERHCYHAPLDCLTAQTHVYLPGRCCQQRLPHSDHTTRTHNRRRRSQQRPYTQMRREQQAHKRHRSMHCKRDRDRFKAMWCQHSSQRLTPCPHQTRTHTPIPPIHQHSTEPASRVAVSDDI